MSVQKRIKYTLFNDRGLRRGGRANPWCDACLSVALNGGYARRY